MALTSIEADKRGNGGTVAPKKGAGANNPTRKSNGQSTKQATPKK
jgi:hypothetical protein